MPVKQGKMRRERQDATTMAFADGTDEFRERLYQDVEERRLKEWDNYQRSHRADEDQHPNRAFIDVTVDDALVGRLVVELFDSAVPQTVEHFRALITGGYGVDEATGCKLDYLHAPLVSVSAEEQLAVFGSTGDSSAVTRTHPLRDENFSQRHCERGLLTMMSRGPHTGGCAFGVTLGAAPQLDFHQVVFGRVADGLPVLERLEALPANAVGRPLRTTTISLCGVLTGERPPGSWREGISTAAASVTNAF